MNISQFPQITLDILHILQVIIFDLFLLNCDLHVPELVFHLLKSVSQILLLDVLTLKLVKEDLGLVHGVRNVFVLVDPHPNSLILESQRVLVCFLPLSEKLLNLTAVLSIVLAALVYLLDQSLLHILLQKLDVELLVLSVKVLQELSLIFHVSVNSQKGRDLFRHDVN